MSKRTTPTERDEALATLRAMLPPGSTVYTILRHVSRSGMQRSISAVVLEDGEPHQIDYLVRRVLDLTFDQRRDGLKIAGCGMDMGFYLVSTLSRVLYPDGFGCIGDGGENERLKACPSNDHSNGDRDYTPHKPEAECYGATGEHCPCHREHWHKSGDYALRHRWI